MVPAGPESNIAAPATKVPETHKAAADDAVDRAAAADKHASEVGPSNTAGDTLLRWASNYALMCVVTYG